MLLPLSLLGVSSKPGLIFISSFHSLLLELPIAGVRGSICSVGEGEKAIPVS